MLSSSSSSTLRPSSAGGAKGAFWSTNMACTSGWRFRLRSGETASTSLSNGTSCSA
jgi:hypothetical protein